MVGPERLIRIDDPADPRISEFISMRDRDLAGRGELFIAEGRVVLQALADALDATAADGGARFALEKALILENRVAGLGDLIARLAPDCPVYIARRDVLDAAVGFAMHRGILALGRRLPAKSLDGFLSDLPDTALLAVACGISNHDNIGGIFRNAGAFGADGVVIDQSCCDPLYRKAIRVSVGAALRVPFCRGGSIAELVAELVRHRFEVTGLSPRGSVALSRFQPGRRQALLLGTEGEGLPEAIFKSIKTLRIEQAPGLDSLNVATSSGIALWQAARQMGRIGD
jgi:tRNA G18 (ribose-2'-O)-methylase SpoU